MNAAVDRVERDFERPPYDTLAEAAVLSHLLIFPHKMADYNAGPLLTAPEHQAIWRAMVRTRAKLGDGEHNYGEWYIEWMRELWRAHGRAGSAALDALVNPERLDNDIWERWERERKLHRGPEPLYPLPGTAYIDYWFGRLQSCAEARRLISTAQTIAEQAWRAPDGGIPPEIASKIVREAAVSRTVRVIDFVEDLAV